MPSEPPEPTAVTTGVSVPKALPEVTAVVVLPRMVNFGRKFDSHCFVRHFEGLQESEPHPVDVIVNALRGSVCTAH